MIILPAIDLKDGKCVRLYKGDFGTVHQVAEDAVDTAKTFAAAGARYIHMVDLDGALGAGTMNAGMVKSVAESVPVKIELGGGMRTMADLDAADKFGVYRMIIGSAAVKNPNFVSDAVEKYKDRIAVGIDAKDGLVRVSGWRENSGLDYVEFAKSMEVVGVKAIIFTDIDTDGALQGPCFDSLVCLKNAVSCDIIASGGVSSIEDIERLRDLGMYGAIIGKAYYAGAVDLKEAIEKAGAQV